MESNVIELRRDYAEGEYTGLTPAEALTIVRRSTSNILSAMRKIIKDVPQDGPNGRVTVLLLHDLLRLKDNVWITASETMGGALGDADARAAKAVEEVLTALEDEAAGIADPSKHFTWVSRIREVRHALDNRAGSQLEEMLISIIVHDFYREPEDNNLAD